MILKKIALKNKNTYTHTPTPSHTHIKTKQNKTKQENKAKDRLQFIDCFFAITFLLFYRQQEIDIEIDHSKKDAADAAVDAVIALLNTSKGGRIILHNKTKSTNPKENFISSFDKRMNEFDLIQPHDFCFRHRGHTLNNLEIIVHPSKRKVLHIFKENSPSLNKKWGLAYTSFTGCVAEIRTTETILRIIRSNDAYEIPSPQHSKMIQNKEISNLDEGTTVEFKEFGQKNLGQAVKEVVKYVCAFANCMGGLILLGVTDKRTIKGFTYSQFGECTNLSQITNEVKKQVGNVVVLRYKHGKLVNQNPRHLLPHLWDLEEFNVFDKDGKDTGRRVVVIRVSRVQNGVVFLKAPKCPYYDKQTGQIIPPDKMSVQTWCDLANECL